MSNFLFHAYKNARNILSGNNETGMKVFPGMFDSDVVSLLRRRHKTTLVRHYFCGLLALLDDGYSPDDYHVITHNAELKTWIIDNFRADGIHENLAKNIVLSRGSSGFFDAYLPYLLYIISEKDVFIQYLSILSQPDKVVKIILRKSYMPVYED